MLLCGVGGMGKSHLIDVCRRNYDNPLILHEECTSSFTLKSLFKTCKILYSKNLTTIEERQSYFLEEFCKQNIYLILDDFYETTDFEIRSLLPKLASIPSGKILLVSRAVPKELENVGFHFEKYFIPALNEPNFNIVLKNYILDEKKDLQLSNSDLNKIFAKAQGYPLGGQLIVDLLFLGDKLDDILADLPKFEAELDVEGKKFSGRLLDNIFRKGNPKEIKLLCEFSALFGASRKELIRELPAYKEEPTSFNTLVNRRRFIWRDENGLFNSHAMIKDYAYEKLSDKHAIHYRFGKYFENKLFSIHHLDSFILESAIQHYKRVGVTELKRFGQRVDWEYNISDVKSLIEENVHDTIRNYKNLLDVYPEKLAYYNELGMAYRILGDIDEAIKTFLKGLKVEADNVRVLNELGITYRERKQKGDIDEAIKTFLKGLKVEADNVRVLNELGITYRERKQKGDIDEAIKTFLKAIEIDDKHLPSYNELGITYRVNCQFEEAINICEKAVNLRPNNKQTYLNLLQIYLFFKPSKNKAAEIFNKLNHPPYHSSFKSNKNKFQLKNVK